MKKVLWAFIILAAGFVSGCGSGSTSSQPIAEANFDTVKVAVEDVKVSSAKATSLGSFRYLIWMDNSIVVNTDKTTVTAVNKNFTEPDYINIPEGATVELFEAPTKFIVISWYDANANIYRNISIYGEIYQ